MSRVRPDLAEWEGVGRHVPPSLALSARASTATKSSSGLHKLYIIGVKAKVKRNVIGNCNYWKELSAYSSQTVNYRICKRPNW